MSLSNWSTFAVDQSGEPTNGVFRSPLGVIVEFYKDWLFVRDEVAWQDGSRFQKPTVMQIEQGIVRYKDVTILARRGPEDGIFAPDQVRVEPRLGRPQDGVYAAVWWRSYNPYQLTGMVGCGVYAYDEAGDFVGVERASVKWLQAQLLQAKQLETWREHIGDMSAEAAERWAQECEYRILQREGNVALVEGAVDIFDIPNELRSVSFDKALQFNHGLDRAK